MTSEPKEWPKDAWLEEEPLTRLVASLIAAEVAASRKQDAQRLRPDLWDGSLGIIDTGLALDSLERTNCAAALNAFFHLSDYGAEDYLLAAETLADWVYIVALSIAHGSGQVTFTTSGSTGAPKPCTHALADLKAEADFWATQFPDCRQIAALVPAHHIYGFIFTVLLPQRMDVPLIDLRCSGAGPVKQALQAPGTLVIGAPVHWKYVSRSLLTFLPDTVGVSSAAPMPAQLCVQLKAQGLGHLTEVYGSSETAGIGFRTSPSDPYTLLPQWSADASGDSVRLIHAQTGTTHHPMDRLSLQGDDQFRLQGRKDGAVQVGGVNVFPGRIADVLSSHPDVADCAVRAAAPGEPLGAYIVPADEALDRCALEDSLRAFSVKTLTAPERPRSYAFGKALHKNEMGKAAAW